MVRLIFLQVRGIFSEYGLEPKNIRAVSELQLALGFVAAGEGVCIVPESAQNIRLAHLNFIPLLDEFAVSPVLWLFVIWMKVNIFVICLMRSIRSMILKRLNMIVLYFNSDQYLSGSYRE